MKRSLFFTFKGFRLKKKNPLNGQHHRLIALIRHSLITLKKEKNLFSGVLEKHY